MTRLCEGKVAIVSGIGPGMGRDISLQLAEHGAKVVAGARTMSNVEGVVKEIEAQGGDAVGVHLDITNERPAERGRQLVRVQTRGCAAELQIRFGKHRSGREGAPGEHAPRCIAVHVAERRGREDEVRIAARPEKCSAHSEEAGRCVDHADELRELLGPDRSYLHAPTSLAQV